MTPEVFRSHPGTQLSPSLIAAEQFGMNWEGASNSATVPGGVSAAWGITDFTYVRIFNWTGCDWSGIEGSAGVYDFTALKAAITNILAHVPTARIIYCPGGTPQLGTGYASDPKLAPTDPAKFAAFITAALNTVGVGDKLYAVEWRNEVNDTGFFTDTPANLLAQVAAGYGALKAVRPKIISLTPSVVNAGGPGYLSTYLALGGAQYADAVAIHLYPASATPTVVSLIPQVQQYETVLLAYPALRGLWVTECGWGNDIAISDHDLQAAFLGQLFITMLFLGVTVVVWYSMNGSASNGHWGTLYDIVGLALTKAGTAFGYVKAWLAGATETSLQIAGTIAYATLTRAGGYTGTAVWNTAGASSYTPPVGTTEYRDLAGNTTAWSSGPVTIGPSPILFENL